MSRLVIYLFLEPNIWCAPVHRNTYAPRVSMQNIWSTPVNQNTYTPRVYMQYIYICNLVIYLYIEPKICNARLLTKIHMRLASLCKCSDLVFMKNKKCPRVAAYRRYVGHVPSWKVGGLGQLSWEEKNTNNLFVKTTPSGRFHFDILIFFSLWCTKFNFHPRLG